ncbi:hypothetical protein MKW98_010459, partial [Papaver atlanticum]
MIRAYAQEHELKDAFDLFTHMRCSGLEFDLVMSSALVSGYSKLGLVDIAHIVFDGI